MCESIKCESIKCDSIKRSVSTMKLRANWKMCLVFRLAPKPYQNSHYQKSPVNKRDRLQNLFSSEVIILFWWYFSQFA